MNPINQNYDPATDENQGVMTTMIQADEANNGVSQVERMSPVQNQGPEPIKEEVTRPDENVSNGVNKAMLAEEDVEAGDATVDVDYEDGDN